MRKEIYKIKCPKHIIFGDPQYFEEFKGAELKRLTVDYKPSEYFDTARLVLQEQPNQEFPDYMERSITLYLAPRQTMETYLKGMIFTSQKVAQKNIGVDTAAIISMSMVGMMRSRPKGMAGGAISRNTTGQTERTVSRMPLF